MSNDPDWVWNERIAEVEAERDMLKQALDEKDQHCLKWKRALEGLTPGGSEFVDDPEACARFVRERRASQHEIALKATKRAQEKDQHYKQLVEACERATTDGNDNAELGCECIAGWACHRCSILAALNPTPTDGRA